MPKRKLPDLWGKSPRTIRSSPSIPHRPAMQSVPNVPSAVMTSALATVGNNNVTAPTTKINLPLQLAIERHLNALPEADKEAFRLASKQITNENLLLSIKGWDIEHEEKSRFRPHAEALSRFLNVLDRFMAGVALGVQANPDISSIVVGAVRVVIDLAMGFASFFTKLSEMLCRFDVLDHSAQALGLNATLGASRDERDRRERERADEREKFLTWVSNIPFEKIHEDIYAKKHPGTGDWLLQTLQFQNWLNSSDSALLWCYGQPGAGKSVLASNVLEHITMKDALHDDVGISFAYYNYQMIDLFDVSQIISALIKQLCRKKDAIPPGYLKVKQDAMDRSQLGNQDSFEIIAREFKEVFVVIDALDECPRDSRPKILGFLSKIVNTLPCAKVFVTSRREADIEEAFEKLNTPSIQIEARNVTADISRYVSSETKKLRDGYDGKRLYVMSDALEEKIIRTLTDKAEGMFLWVNLQLSNLCQVSESRKDREVEKALDMVPAGLDSTYVRILEQINSQSEYMRTLAFKSFRWVVYAQRPLTTKELQHALATEDSCVAVGDSELDTVAVILRACANLLIAENPGNYWEFIIRPIHYSVQEFFTTTNANKFQGLHLDTIRDREQVHSKLASTCISHLQLRLTGQSPCRKDYILYKRVHSFPFSWYAARYFDYHLLCCKSLPEELSEQIMTLLRQPESFLAAVLQLRAVPHLPGILQAPSTFEDFDPHDWAVDINTLVYASELYNLPDLRTHWKSLQPPPFALHRACYAGLRNVVARLLADRSDVNAVDEKGTTPIYHAANREDLSILEMLLDEGAKVNTQGGYFGNTLQSASYRGHEKIVELLLDKGAEINAQVGYYGNALQAASYRGHEKIVELLHKRGAKELAWYEDSEDSEDDEDDEDDEGDEDDEKNEDNENNEHVIDSTVGAV